MPRTVRPVVGNGNNDILIRCEASSVISPDRIAAELKAAAVDPEQDRFTLPRGWCIHIDIQTVLGLASWRPWSIEELDCQVASSRGIWPVVS